MTTTAYPDAADMNRSDQSQTTAPQTAVPQTAQTQAEPTLALPTDVLPADQLPREDGHITDLPVPPGTSAPHPPVTPGLEAGPARTAEPAERYRSFSIASFVLGIVSVVAGWTFFAPVTGLVLGVIALRRGTPERTLTIWGVVLNAVMVGLFVLAAMLFVMLALAGLIALPFAA